MTNIKCFRQRFQPTNANSDPTPVLSSLIFQKPLGSIVRREGSRMVDNGTFTFHSNVGIQMNDFIGYLQDDISLEKLVACWNFTTGCRDESGYDIHSQNEFASNYSCPIVFKKNEISGRVKGRLAGYFNDVQLTIPNKQDSTATSYIDLSLDFSITMSIAFQDMNSWGSISNEFDVVLFQKYESADSHGIKLILRHFVDHDWKFVIGTGDGTTYTETLSGVYTTSDLQGIVNDLVLGRKNNNVFLKLNTTEIITNSSYSANMTTDANILIGQSQNFDAYIYQIKIYTRALTDEEIETTHKFPIPISLLKFYGRVWKIDSKETTNTFQCNGLANIILNTKIDESILDDDVSNVRNKNIYTHSLRTNQIITNILDKVNAVYFGNHIKRFITLTGTTSGGLLQEYVLDDRSTTAGNAENFYRLKGRFIANGTLLDLLNTLCVLDDCTFTFTPTGVITFVKNSNIPRLRRIISKEVGFQMTTGGEDVTPLVNHLVSEGTSSVYNNSAEYNNPSPNTDYFVSANNEDINTSSSASEGSVTNDYTGNIQLNVVPHINSATRDILKESAYITFNADGSKLYTLIGKSGLLKEYDLTTPWDVTTYTFNQSKDLGITGCHGMQWGNSGGYLYVIRLTSASFVYRFTASSTYNISTLNTTFGNYQNVDITSNTDNKIESLFIKDDGTKIWFLSKSNNKLYQYTMGSAWSLTSSFNYSKSVNVNNNEVYGLWFKSDGTKLYFIDAPNKSYLQCSLSTAWDIGTSITPVNQSLVTVGGNAFDQYVKPDDSVIFIANCDANQSVREVSLTSVWKITSLNYNATTSPYFSPPASTRSVRFNDDGTKVYFLASNVVYEYACSTAYDITTASLTTNFSVATQDSNMTGLHWKSDGTKFYTIGYTNDRVYEYVCSTPWSLSTASYNNVFFAHGSESTPWDIWFKTDGTRLYIVGSGSDYVRQFTLTSAWDLSTATTTGSTSYYVGGAESSPYGLSFSDDGTKFWISGFTSGWLRQYNMSTAWNLTTASAGDTAFFGASTLLYGMTWNPNGESLYQIVGNSNRVYQLPSYSISFNNARVSAVDSGILELDEIVSFNAEAPLTVTTDSTQASNDDTIYVNIKTGAIRFSMPDGYDGKVYIRYEHDRFPPENPSGSFTLTDSVIQSSENNLSIIVFGLLSRKISIPYLDAGSDITKFNTKFLLRNAKVTIPRRVTLRTIGLINDIFENNEIGAYYDTKGIGSIDNDGFNVPEYMIIKKIEYRYPESMTTIELGDFEYDSFDLERITNETVRGIQSS